MLTAIGLTPGGSSTVHIYIKTIHRTQLTTLVGRLSGIRTQSGQTKINEYTGKVKVKITLEHAMKAQMGADVKIYSSFNLGARWRWVVNATPPPALPPVPIV